MATITNPSTDIATCVGWWDASNAGSITGSPIVTNWDNLDGGVDFTATNGPTTGSGTLNGLNVLVFDGSNDMMTLAGAATLAAQPLTVTIVVKYDTKAADRHITDEGAGGRLLITGETNWAYYAGGTPQSGSASNTSWHIVTNVFSGGSSRMFIDGTQIISGDSGSSPVSGGWQLGAGNGPMYSAIRVAELVVCSSNISLTSERADLESYLNSKWFGAPAAKAPPMRRRASGLLTFR